VVLAASTVAIVAIAAAVIVALIALIYPCRAEAGGLANGNGHTCRRHLVAAVVRRIVPALKR
jgi:hypothetical protein